MDKNFSFRNFCGIMGKGWKFSCESQLIRVEDKTQLHVELDTGHHLLFEWTGEIFIPKTKGCDWFVLSKEEQGFKLQDQKRHRTYWSNDPVSL